jgi:hypothetical protein
MKPLSLKLFNVTGCTKFSSGHPFQNGRNEKIFVFVEVILHVNPVSKLQYILGNILLATLPLILLFRNTLSQGRKERIIPGNPLVHIMDPSESPTQHLGPPKSAIPFKGPFILSS